MCRSVRGATPSRCPVLTSGVLCVAQLFVIGSWEVHARPPLLRSMQALAQWLDCASCVLHRPGGVLLRQNPTASEISDAKFRAIYSGMRKLPTFIIGIEGPGLHHANVNRLVAVG